MDNIDTRLGQFLYEHRVWPAGSDGVPWNLLSCDKKSELEGFAGDFLDEALQALLEVAESPAPEFQDVARQASYWLIELMAQRDGQVQD